MSKHTPGPWRFEFGEIRGSGNVQTNGWPEPRGGVTNASYSDRVCSDLGNPELSGPAANIRLICAAPDLLAALHEGRRAIGDHCAPHDCYATGPLTGDDYRDLVQCPACSFIDAYDAAISKAEGK